MGYLNHKYLYPGYSMDSPAYPSPSWALAALRALLRLRALVATALLAPSFATAMCRSSVSATNRPPRRSLPRPNCHSLWLISYTLLPFLPDSSAALASASPCGNLAPRCWRSWCRMVGVELLSTVSEALDPGKRACSSLQISLKTDRSGKVKI